MASIDLLSIHKDYDDHPGVVRDVSLHVAQGELCVLVGPSGCGKSTLLRMIAGLESISSGELRIDGQRMNETPPARRGVAMVFQSYALFPHMTVFENLAFGMRLARRPRAEVEHKVAEVAKLLQIETLLQRKPRALSGGQRQRVAIGRAMVREPGVFLFDEPLSNLDAALRVQMRMEIARLHRDFGRASTVYVTHDQVEAMTLADRIVVLRAGAAAACEGTVAQQGRPLELYERPDNLFVAGFIGSPRMNLLAGRLVHAHAGHAEIVLPCGVAVRVLADARALPPGAPVTIGLRPEHAVLGDATQHLLRPVRWLERLGEATFLHLDGAGAAPLIVKAPGDISAEAGDRLAVSMPAARLHLFDDAGRALPRCAPPA